MTQTQTQTLPEALRLAGRLELYATGDEFQRDTEDAAACLRRLQAENERQDASECLTIEQRDHAENMADRLAKAISERFRVDIGEHSNLNCPWHQALAVINGDYVTDSDSDRRIAQLEAESQQPE